MANLNGFNAHNVEPRAAFEPLPEAKYIVIIADSVMKPNKAGTGSYLELKFELMEGQYKGRNVWSRLNLENLNPKAVEIAKAELSAICRAVEVMTPQDSAELHNRPLVIKVVCKAGEDGQIRNEIKGYEKKGAPGAPVNGAAQPVGAGASTPPWQRK